MADWKDRIIKSWRSEPPDQTPGDAALKAFLFLLSLPYKTAVSARNVLYDQGILKQTRLSRPVISIGNITAGGTGKTPMTIMLANVLKDAGFKPAVLSRGYGGKSPAAVNVVSDGEAVLMNPEQGGDEPVLIACSCPGIPVIAGPERRLTGPVAIDRFGADILVLDDGFQHRRLYRNIDIVLLDAQRPFGNGFSLPRGPLREAASAVKRAHIVVNTGLQTDRPVDERGGLFFDVTAVFHGRREPRAFMQGKNGSTYCLSHLQGKRLLAFAGIADPDSFKKMLQNLGGDVAVWLPFPDHHRYTEKDINAIKRLAQEAACDAVVATEKDGVKLSGFPVFLETLYLLKIEMVLLPSPAALMTVILDKLNKR